MGKALIKVVRHLVQHLIAHGVTELILHFFLNQKRTASFMTEAPSPVDLWPASRASPCPQGPPGRPTRPDPPSWEVPGAGNGRPHRPQSSRPPGTILRRQKPAQKKTRPAPSANTGSVRRRKAIRGDPPGINVGPLCGPFLFPCAFFSLQIILRRSFGYARAR